MRPYTEAPPQDPSTDGDQPTPQRVFGYAEPDRPEGRNHVGDTVDRPTADPAQPEDQRYTGEQTAADQHRDEAPWHDAQPHDAVADDVLHGERRMDGPGDIDRDDDTRTTHDDAEPTPSDESEHHDPDAETPGADQPTAGPGAAGPSGLDESTDVPPGDVPAAAPTAFWTEDSAQNLRDRWREAQLRFVDDPRKAGDDTRSLVNEAVEALTAALASQREQLNSLPTNGDTEQYRMVVQRYRTFFERVLTL